MIKEAVFLKCGRCNTVVEALSGRCCDEMMCCMQPMEIIKPNLLGSEENHMPVVKRDGCNLTICVGRILHPMSEEHRILWVEIRDRYIVRRINLKSGSDPIISVFTSSKEPVTVYAYCSRHGLWRTSA